ncbi:unnamed protein product [Heterosigma akashiwo]
MRRAAALFQGASGYCSPIQMLSSARRSTARSSARRSTARRVHPDNNELVDSEQHLQATAKIGDEQRDPPHDDRSYSLAETIDQFSELARRAFITEVYYFVFKALAFRRQVGGSQTKRQRASFFRDIMEEFVLDDSPLRLDFLSTSTRCALNNHYLALPFELVPRGNVEEGCQSSDYLNVFDDCWYGMAEEHTAYDVFDAAMIEALQYAHAVFNQHGVPTTCLAILNRYVAESY